MSAQRHPGGVFLQIAVKRICSFRRIGTNRTVIL